jgi:hypothetical protein
MRFGAPPSIQGGAEHWVHERFDEIDARVFGRSLLFGTSLAASVFFDFGFQSELLQIGLLICLATAIGVGAKGGLYALAFLAITARDIGASDAGTGGGIWSLALGPASAGPVLAASLATIATWRVMLAPSAPRRIPWLVMLYFGPILLFVSFAHGYLRGNWGHVSTDLKYPVFLLLTFFITHDLFRSQVIRLEEFWCFLLIVLCGRHGADAWHLVTEGGTFFGTAAQLSADSTKGTVVLLLFTSLYGCMHRRGMIRLYSAGGMTVSVGLLVAYLTRTIWISAALGLMVFLGLRVGKGTRALLVAVAIIGGTIYGFTTMFPDSTKSLLFRVQSINVVEPGLSFQIRLISTANAVAQLWERGRWLTGEGYGSWYTDDAIAFPAIVYRDPDYIRASFGEESITSRKFFRIHQFVVHTIFKYGLIGFLCIVSMWLLPAWRCVKGMTALVPDRRVVATILLSGVPVLIQFYWSAKGAFLSGIFVATLLVLSEDNVGSSGSGRRG